MKRLFSSVARFSALAVMLALPALLHARQPAYAAEEPPPPTTQAEAPDADDGDDFMAPRTRPQAEQPAPQPPPAGAPSTEKQGEDLIVHGDGTDTRFAHFFAGMQQGEVRAMILLTAQRGKCAANIDFNGAVVDMKCDR